MTDKDKGVSTAHVNKEQLAMFRAYYGINPWTYVNVSPYDLLNALEVEQGGVVINTDPIEIIDLK